MRTELLIHANMLRSNVVAAWCRTYNKRTKRHNPGTIVVFLFGRRNDLAVEMFLLFRKRSEDQILYVGEA